MGVGGKGHAQAALPSGKASCKYVSATGTGYFKSIIKSSNLEPQNMQFIRLNSHPIKLL